MVIAVDIEKFIVSFCFSGVVPVRFEQWLKIDNIEKSRGVERGKVREKIVDVQEMLRVASS